MQMRGMTIHDGGRWTYEGADAHFVGRIKKVGDTWVATVERRGEDFASSDAPFKWRAIGDAVSRALHRIAVETVR